MVRSCSSFIFTPMFKAAANALNTIPVTISILYLDVSIERLKKVAKKRHEDASMIRTSEKIPIILKFSDTNIFPRLKFRNNIINKIENNKKLIALIIKISVSTSDPFFKLSNIFKVSVTVYINGVDDASPIGQKVNFEN